MAEPVDAKEHNGCAYSFKRPFKSSMKFLETEWSKRNHFQSHNDDASDKRKNPRSTRQRTSSPRIILLVLLSFSLFTCEGVALYGTDSGYDVEGGTDPICWDSKVRWEDARVTPNTTQELDDNFDTMNGKMFANDSDVNDIDVTLRTSCYKGMNLTITPNVPNVSVA